MEHKTIHGYLKYKIYEDGTIENYNGLKLKPETSTGYARYTLTNELGSHRTFAAHRLVAHCFLNYDLNNYEFEVDHLDRDKLNNHKDNLEIVTKSENCRRRSGREPNSNIDTATHKQCSKCLNLKPRSEYSTGKRCVDGIGSWCGDCTKSYKREYVRIKQPTKIVSEKRCTKCDTVKHTDYFSPSKGSADGFGSWCKTCQKDYRRIKNNL